MQMIADKFGYQKSKITSGNPRGNDPAENLVHRAKLCITNLAEKFPLSWNEFTGMVQYSLSMAHDDDMSLPRTQHSQVHCLTRWLR